MTFSLQSTQSLNKQISHFSQSERMPSRTHNLLTGRTITLLVVFSSADRTAPSRPRNVAVTRPSGRPFTIDSTSQNTVSSHSSSRVGRLKMREWKMRYGKNCKGGKCRSKPYGTPTRDYIETALSYFVILVLILLTE